MIQTVNGPEFMGHVLDAWAIGTPHGGFDHYPTLPYSTLPRHGTYRPVRCGRGVPIKARIERPRNPPPWNGFNLVYPALRRCTYGPRRDTVKRLITL